MPTFKQLSYLVALSQELHFRRAAERMNVTQPTLSQQIQELERQLKAPLVEREAGRVTITPLGRVIVERARHILSEIDDIKKIASASQHGFEGTIRVGVPSTIGPYLLPHIVPEMHKNYPNLKLYVKEGKPGDLQLELKEGLHDFVISPLPIQHADLQVVRLFREALLVVTAPDHPLAGRKQIRREDLAGQNILAIERGHHLHDQVMGICEEFGANPLRDYEGTSLDTLRLMAGMGVGIAFLPALYLGSEMRNNTGISVMGLTPKSLNRHIGVAWRKRSAHGGLFNEISDLIRNIAEQKLPQITITPA